MGGETLTDAISQAIKFHLIDLHTCLPAKIEKYDYSNQIADVKPLIKKKYVDGTIDPLPVIVNVPVVFPRTTNAMIHFPLEKGDGVLLVFAERSLDTWLSKGGDSEPGGPRKFDLSDAIAIPGLFDFKATTLAENNDDFLIVYKGGKIVIKKTGLMAFGNGNQELLDLLDQFLDAVIASTTATAIGPQPLSKVVDTTIPQIKVKLAQLKGGL